MRAFALACAAASLLAAGCESRPRRSGSGSGPVPYPAKPVPSEAPANVTMAKTNATVLEIVEEFRRQSDLSITVEIRPRDEFPRMTFTVREQPARSALEAFAKQAELEATWRGSGSVTLRPTPRVWCTFKDADVRDVIDRIARVSGASIVVSPRVRGTLTLSVNGVPWMDVLEAVARTTDLLIIREDSGILRIHKEE